MYYTGIGSRETPEHVCNLMTKVAEKLSKSGWILRSGGAQGADKAFLDGCMGRTENYIPWRGFGDFGGTIPNLDVNWSLLQNIANLNPLIYKPTTRSLDKYKGFWKLQARNVSQILGLNLDSPSKFCILYAPTTATGVIGGTNTAYQVAVQNNVPCFNLFIKDDYDRLSKFVE